MDEKQNNTKTEELDEFPEYKIKTFSIKDKSLKQLGELLANETSRSIIILLAEEELYVNQIAETLNMRVSLVIHHLQKLEGLGIMDIVEKPITRKTKNHRFFRMRTNIFLEFLEDKKIKEVLQAGLKISAIGITAGVFYIGKLPFSLFDKTQTTNIAKAFNPDDYIEVVTEIPFYEQSTFSPMLIIIVGLIINNIISYKKRKKG